MQWDAFIESPMHLLFEGVHGKLFGSAFPDFFKLHGIWTKVWRFVNGFYLLLRKCHISWLPIYPLAKKYDAKNVTYSLSGWRGVNHIASTRLFKLGFCHVRSIIWVKDGDKKLQHSLDVFELLVQVFQAMVSQLMHPFNVEPRAECIHKYVKLFLSISIRFSNLTNGFNEKQPLPFRGGNFQGLLNLRNQIYVHGSPRNTWDGDSERTIQFMKPFITNRRKTGSYYASRLKTAGDECTVSMFTSEFASLFNSQLCADVVAQNVNKDGNRVNVYEDVDTIKAHLLSGDTVEGVLCSQNNLCFLVSLGHTRGEVRKLSYVSVYRALFLDDNGIDVSGCWVCPVSVDESNCTFASLQSIDERVLLVRPPGCIDISIEDDVSSVKVGITPQVRSVPLYYAFTDGWKERKRNGQFHLPVPDSVLLKKCLSSWDKEDF